MAAQPTDSAIATWLAETANKTNHYLPITSAGVGMRMDRTTAGPGRRFTYHYTYINNSASQFNKSAWRAQIDSELRNTCQEKDVIQFLKYGVTVTYAYFGNDGGLVGSVDVTPKFCDY